MTDIKDDYIFTYNDTNRHGLASGTASAAFFIAACACPFMHDISFLLAALALSLIGGLTALYGTYQAKFNSKNRFPKYLCKTAMVLNALCFTGILVYLVIGITALCITGGR